MQLTCPSCAKSLRIADGYSGKQVHCSDCGTSIPVARPRSSRSDDVWEVGAEDVVDAADDAVDGQLVSPGKRPAADTKTCPMCGETIKSIARKCRFCGENLSGVTGPDGRPTSGVWREGNRLVMTKDAQLPYICVKTNQPADGWLRRKLSWHNPFIYLSILAGLLIYVILALIVRETADIKIGLCRARLKRRHMIIAGAWLAALLGFVLMFVGIANSNANNSAWIFIVIGILTILAGLVVAAILLPVVSPSRITKRYIWLKGVHPGFLATLPPFPGED